MMKIPEKKPDYLEVNNNNQKKETDIQRRGGWGKIK